MATLAAPGFYEPVKGVISTTIDAMGHQSTDSGPYLGSSYWRQRLDLENAGSGVLAGNFGSRRGRRFANAPSV